jgi:peptidoglycan/LPS O-acetylase OafA/YrhL
VFDAPSSAGPNAPAPRTLGYRPELDGIRGVAIVLVMLTHSSAFLEEGAAVLYSGFFGVDAFFVLSGFLITTLLLEERGTTGDVRLARFFRRRFWRLVPALLFGVGIAGLGAALVGANLRGVSFPTATLYALAFVGNWSGHSLGLLAHAWSLGVEAQYYLVWPLIVVVLVRRGWRPESLAIGAAVGALVVASLRVMVVHEPGPVELLHGVLRTDAMMLGSAIGVLFVTDRERLASMVAGSRVIWSAIAGLIAYIAYAEIGGRLGRASFSKDILFVGSISVAVLLARIVTRPGALSRALSSRPVVGVGKLSYSLYLVHYPVFRTLARVGPEHGWSAAAIGWTASFGLALVSYALIERPALRFKGGASRPRKVLLDRESVGRRRDAGLQVERSRREQELVDAV